MDGARAYRAIQGNVTRNGGGICHLPGGRSYVGMKIETGQGRALEFARGSGAGDGVAEDESDRRVVRGSMLARGGM